ncbi:hypothetical protein DT076_14325 [Desertihabitans brevis]|uniref:ABC-2 type transport system permease protein n=1 Tax=Desertihabitans brevis TaxID=2268447 RepID=A0A367YS90_9ACTN|nr:hypothetical protein [Desertihabitans brevis]RCK68755.1 hypothetical protein DT076_14325 [Desertihabitans brevis]
MVGVLISLKLTLLRHSPKGLRQTGWVLGALLVLSTWAGVLLATAGAVRVEVQVLTAVGWGVGAVLGPVLMSGAGVLRAEYFTLLPLDRSRLALGLLAAVFPSVASGYLLLALLAAVVPAVALGPLAVAVAVLGALLAWVVVITLARLVYAALGSAMRTWLGVEIAGLQFGLLIGAMLAGWMVVAAAFQTVPLLLAEGLPDDVTAVLAVLPTSWPVRAAEAVGTGRTGTGLAWLLALALLAALLLALAAVLLRPNLDGRSRRRNRRPLGSRRGRRLLPDTALGAVLGKELRQWWRDPWRALELRSGFYTGVVFGVFSAVSGDFAVVAPLSGLVIALMICLAACNLYGQDGSAVWVSIVNQRPDTVTADVRGRQLAVLLLVLPPAAVVSVVLVLVSDAAWAWPVVAAGLPALAGVASGIAVLVSAVGVSPGVDPRARTGPNDAGGDMGLQAQVALWGTLLLVLPTAVALVVGFVALPGWGPWAAVAVGVLNGALGYGLLGRLTTGYLATRLPTVYTRIRYGRNDDTGARGTLGWFETSSQQAEEKAREAKLAERRARAERRMTPTGRP